MRDTFRSSKIRVGALATAAALTAAGGLIVTGNALAETAGCGVFFDDFGYASTADAAFTGNGWRTRDYAGGPGVPGATWSAANVSFTDVDGQRVAQLRGSTDGTAGGTTQAEFYQGERRFFEGTYAARIRLSDTPVSGQDGDHVNQTFFAMGPTQRFDYDPDYSELDFTEYLPNGGWGTDGPANYETSWNGFKEDPWDPYNASTAQDGSLAGWHTIVGQAVDGRVTYFVDGEQVATHTVDEKDGSRPVSPRVEMAINFNLWFIDTAGHRGDRATYQEHIDWVYYADEEAVAPADLEARTAAYRAAGTAHEDTLGGC
ncbi:glycoside hydrolase family 16 protein [Catenuloplanes japonicus]|uniref:glycoside hydrolase family 16 protein n=1 Tax=Catenuloplanes japonicus TaxID=33876 RepID=UPI0005244797|nr:glycoside hydrolase family 16 protein [Catenuloplanes japonicus]